MREKCGSSRVPKDGLLSFDWLSLVCNPGRFDANNGSAYVLR